MGDLRRIGSLRVSAAGLGCNNFGTRMDSQRAREVVAAALDCGVNFFDTADVYGSTYGESESILADALGGAIGDVVVTTKFGSPSHGRAGGAGAAYIVDAVEGSLRRLGTERIDLYQLHRFDPSTPVEETVGCLKELVDRGMVGEVGLSNCGAAQIEAFATAGKAVGLSFASLQNRYNLLEQADLHDGLSACSPETMTYLPYFPLASGMLTGKYQFGHEPPSGSRIAKLGNEVVGGVVNERNDAIVTELQAWAGARGHSVGDAAIAWLLHDQRIASVIAGATTVEQVRANSAGAAWELTPDDKAAIDQIVAANPAVG
jgi:aryl-alcohol dehydrogenase-like predicted oxidoreductase